ncbi:GAF and ANTAR domain-containing protein [Rhabdothermincola salaria]|uniref:GAF and ANTAR domain-containing protein n=1 Tax=Rhabdothermincola salaria TaxID=2903142 RepID=UPI001E4962B2|nr:GAF and ANTAR domain-containing protein [Rhabdothermincola salaria]MCD9625229.1 GAF and ANTAR domain-containing protein [Rhabdothermincola salaria]
MTDQQALSRVLRQFARTMTGSYDITEVLYDLSGSVADVLDATAAGVALLDGEELRFVTATSDLGTDAERAQERFQDGPCLDSIRENQPVVVHDIGECHERWPGYAPVVEQLGLHAVLGIPLVLDDRRVGSLDVYSDEPRSWSDDEVNAALVLADVAAAYVVNASELLQSQRTTEQLQRALAGRVVIEQAKGVLAERARITTEEAFQRIRASARRQSVKIADVCRRVIDTDYVPD